MALVLTTIASAAPLTSYVNLVAAVANWTHRTDLGDRIPEFVRLAEARINQDLRLRTQIKVTQLVIPTGQTGVSLPDDWLELNGVSITDTPERALSFISNEQMANQYVRTGIPQHYTIQGDVLTLGPVQDGGYTLNLSYYARNEPLAQTGTNTLMSRNPSIYLFAVLIEAMFFTRDMEQLQAYTQRYQSEVTQLQMADDRATHSGSMLRIRTRNGS